MNKWLMKLRKCRKRQIASQNIKKLNNGLLGRLLRLSGHGGDFMTQPMNREEENTLWKKLQGKCKCPRKPSTTTLCRSGSPYNLVSMCNDSKAKRLGCYGNTWELQKKKACRDCKGKWRNTSSTWTQINIGSNSMTFEFYLIPISIYNISELFLFHWSIEKESKVLCVFLHFLPQLLVAFLGRRLYFL